MDELYAYEIFDRTVAQGQDEFGQVTILVLARLSKCKRKFTFSLGYYCLDGVLLSR